MTMLDSENRSRTHVRIPRRRKVGYRNYNYEPTSPHPLIRLGGKYLEAYGFRIGDAIELQFEHGRITITVSFNSEPYNSERRVYDGAQSQ